MSMNNKYFSIISKTKEELDIEKELVNNIKNDEDFVDEVIRPLKISHELFMDYLFAFVDAQKEFHNCKNCQGFDKCPNAHKGMRAIITNDKKFVSTKYEMCQYYLDDKRIKNCFIYNEFPAQFSDTFLKHMKLFSNGYRQLLKLTLNKKIKGHDRTWIYVYGDKDINNIIKRIFNENDINTSYLLYGKDAIDRIKSGKKYDYIIIEDDMKEISGYETLKGLKNINKFNTPCIVMLNNNKEQIKEHYIKDGFSDYIMINDLKNELKRIIDKY